MNMIRQEDISVIKNDTCKGKKKNEGKIKYNNYQSIRVRSILFTKKKEQKYLG